MKLFSGRTAFITGGASGIGLGIARACGKRGMNVMIADIEAQALSTALEELRGEGITSDGLVLNVASRDAVEAAAASTVERFGKVHLLCNNAGVSVADPVGAITPGDWDWIVDVNLKGVVYGVEAFVPLMRAHGEGGHVVNTGSAAGLIHFPGASSYAATKWAVVGMSEAWRGQLASENIGLSVLCPGAVATRILESDRNRETNYGQGGKLHFDPRDHANASAGISPEIVGEHVMECVATNEPYIVTHAAFRPVLEMALERRMAAFDATRSSKSMGQLPEAPLPDFF